MASRKAVATPQTLDGLHAEMVSCRRCPRLVAWRERVAREKRRAYADQEYWGRPVTGFGDPDATLLIVGLAPGAHGANRTGRIFTGDRSGEFLYAALYRAGVSSAPQSVSRHDGLRLSGIYITCPCRCAPPANKPSPAELDACAPWLDAELALLPRVRVVLALGRIAWDATLDHARRRVRAERSRTPFGHGSETEVGGIRVVGSYHVSQQNTQTGRLTPAMFDEVVQRALAASRTEGQGTRSV